MAGDISISVLIIDDSTTDRGLIFQATESRSEIKVIGEVSSADHAMAVLRRADQEEKRPSVIILDSDMPGVSGLDILPQILEIAPYAKVIMSMPLNAEAAKKGIRALRLGATDYIIKVKPTEDAKGYSLFKKELLEKIIDLGMPRMQAAAIKEQRKKPAGEKIPPGGAAQSRSSLEMRKVPPAFMPGVLAISSSTGGPQVLTELLSSFKGKNVKIPIFITQHMPRNFTSLLAEQLSMASGLECVEASDGMEIESGKVFVAPGDFHMLVKRADNKFRVELSDAPPENFCRPAADPMLLSIIEAYGGHKILAIVLTGMGSDGYQGCKKLTEKNGVVIAQDYETSAVWGMPGRVAKGGLCSFVLPPKKISEKIIELFGGKIS